MNRYVVGMACLWMAGLVSATAQAQCQSGGSRGGSAGSSAGMVASGARSSGGSYGSSMLTGPGSWAYDQMLGQALARQLAQQAYQKQLADQARRAESLAKRQYWAAQRRAQKAPSANSPGNLLASNARSLNTASYSASSSLDILPSSR